VVAIRPADSGEVLVRIRPAAAAAWALWLLSIAGIGLGLSLGTRTSSDILELIPLLAAFVAYATVGAIIAGRRPRNPIGWLFLAIGILTAVAAIGEPFANQPIGPGSDVPISAVLGAWTEEWFWYPLFAMSTVFTLLLFPSGLPSRRWRPVLWVNVVAVALASLMAALSPTVQVGGRRVPNPIGVRVVPENVEATVPFQISQLVLGLGIAAATVSVFLRFRRSRGEERQQLKWFAYAAALVASTIAVSIAFPAIERSAASQVLFGFAILGIPISCGIAITRYRLYDIDRVINRTLVYAILTALLVGIYVGAAVGVGALVRSLTGQQNNALVIAASTLAVAALFGPARRRIQGFIDRRFYRRKYDAARTLEAFSARLREHVDLDALTGELLAVVRGTMQPAHASLWLRSPESSPAGTGKDVG
jgi:hypothetical protein